MNTDGGTTTEARRHGENTEKRRRASVRSPCLSVFVVSLVLVGLLACRAPEPEPMVSREPELAKPVEAPAIEAYVVRDHAGDCPYGIVIPLEGWTIDPRSRDEPWRLCWKLRSEPGFYCGADALPLLDRYPGCGVRNYRLRSIPGDVNADGRVDLTDLALVKSMNGEPVNDVTCFLDVNLDGEITLTDAALVKSLCGGSK